MNHYWAIQSIGLPTKLAAEQWRFWHYKDRLPGNEISRRKLYVRRDKKGLWRVIRKIWEWELDDPMLGDHKFIAQYRQYLKRQTTRTARIIRGKL
jgi:hypothetical protein